MSWLDDIEQHRKRQVAQMAKAFGDDNAYFQKAKDVDTAGKNEKKDKILADKSDMYKMKVLGLRKFNEQDQKEYIGVEDVANSYITNHENGDIIISKTTDGYLVSKFPIDTDNEEGEENTVATFSEAIDVALQYKDDLDNAKAPEQIMYKDTEDDDDDSEKGFNDEINPFERAVWEAERNDVAKAYAILGLDYNLEKAKHQDGDMHPNGKWVWRQSANGGKGDWRVAKTGGSKDTAGGAAATTKTNAAAKTSSSTLSDKEKNAFADIMKKNSSHKDAHMNLEQMSDDELRKFANAASVLAGDKTNLNDKTRANIKGWMKLAQDEQTARRNNKKTEGATKKTISKQKDNKSSNTVIHDINGTKVTVTKNSDGSYTLEANGKKVKSDDPSFFVNGTNLKPRVKAALAKEVGI